LVVIGDSLLDIDLEGHVERLAPDAPVPVLDDLVEHARPGGAALAASMAAADGHEVVLVTAIGDDEAGARLAALLDGVHVRSVETDGPTPVKQRVRAGGQSLARLDSGSRPGTLRPDPRLWSEALAGAGAVLVADYGRGMADLAALREDLGRLSRRTPTVWDPHPRGGAPVPGCRLATPNQAEAAALASSVPSRRAREATGARRAGLAGAGADAEVLLGHWRVQAVAVTLGEAGALLSYGSGVPVVAPAPPVPCTDPCGAGDRFAVSAALALGSGLVTTEAVEQAVADAAAYVAAGGPRSVGAAAAPPPAGTVDQLLAGVRGRGGTVVATGGCFDLLHAGHVATLRAARAMGDCLVVCVNGDDSVRRLKGPSRPLVPAADRVRVLEALECVDAVVVFHEDTPVEVLRGLRPHLWVKGGDYAGADVPESPVLGEWGGQVVAVPYLEGRSTTRLVESAVAGRPGSSRSDNQEEVA
jgi:rfaE bifunctional protein nucleotidyltransferase chain/domain